jgi:hypothetical protein
MEEDKLIAMWKEQSDFQNNFFKLSELSMEERIKHIKDSALGAYRELGEILYELPTKSHRSSGVQNNDIGKAREEAIDTLKFLLNVCILLEMTPNMLYEMFMEKSSVVRKRFEDEMKTI